MTIFSAHNLNVDEVREVNTMTQTPQEKAITILEVQYENIQRSLNELPGQIEKMVSAAITSHVINCPNQSKKTASIPPPRISEKGWDTLKYIATLVAASAIGGGSLASVQHLFK
jgi:hypothetical protein